MNQPADIYYDPFDVEIDKDPYPVWRRMREEAPLYYNEKHDFFALSRFADVEAAMKDWDTYRSGHGSTLEIIKLNITLPPGIILMEDPPIHDAHRGLLSRVFTPKKMNALEPQVREFCARTLDPLVGTGGFDFIDDLGAHMPMRTIGMLLGISEKDQDEIRGITSVASAGEAEEVFVPDNNDMMTAWNALFSDYVEWRAKNLSDDIMSELLTAEFEDDTGTVRKLTREEILTYVGLLAGAGNETTTRLIGWTGKLLAEHPDQRRDIHENRSLIPNAIEELLRYEAPSPVQARWVQHDVEHYGEKIEEGRIMVLVNGAANRDDRQFPDAERFDIHRDPKHHLSFGFGIHFCLGAALARLEGRIALDEVLNRFPVWDVDWDRAVQAHTANVRGWDHLPVVTP